MPRWTGLALGFVVVLSVGCRAPLPPSVAALGENAEESSAPAEGKIGTSYVLGELAVETQEEPVQAGSSHENEGYRITAYGRPVAIVRCFVRRAGIHFASGDPDDLSCRSGRGWSLHLFYSAWRFPNHVNALRATTGPYSAGGSYAIEAEVSEAANVFRFWPARIDPESNSFLPLPGTKPVAAVVHQPFRNTILLARDAVDHDALLAAAAIVMTIADRVRPGNNPCSSGSLPRQRTCIRGPE